MLVPHLKPTDMQAFIQKYEKCLRSTPNGGPVPIGILVTIDKKPIQYVIDDGLLRHTVADIPSHLHWCANQTFRHSNALLYDSARAASQKRIFSTSRTYPGEFGYEWGEFCLTMLEAATLDKLHRKERRSPGEVVPIGYKPPSFVPPSADELQNWAEGPMYFCSRAMGPATSPVTALLLAKRLGKRYDVGVKQNLEDHFKAQMPKMPAPLSFDNVFTAKIPPPVPPSYADKPLVMLHIPLESGVFHPSWLKGYAPEGYLQEYLASL